MRREERGGFWRSWMRGSTSVPYTILFNQVVLLLLSLYNWLKASWDWCQQSKTGKCFRGKIPPATRQMLTNSECGWQVVQLSWPRWQETNQHWEKLSIFKVFLADAIVNVDATMSSRYLCLLKQRPLLIMLHLLKNNVTTVQQYLLSVSFRLIIPGHSARIVSLNEVTRALTQHSISCEDTQKAKTY